MNMRTLLAAPAILALAACAPSLADDVDLENVALLDALEGSGFLGLRDDHDIDLAKVGGHARIFRTRGDAKEP